MTAIFWGWELEDDLLEICMGSMVLFLEYSIFSILKHQTFVLIIFIAPLWLYTRLHTDDKVHLSSYYI